MQIQPYELSKKEKLFSILEGGFREIHARYRWEINDDYDLALDTMLGAIRKCIEESPEEWIDGRILDFEAGNLYPDLYAIFLLGFQRGKETASNKT
jgi:hypothetical protein